jgi:hypothetical protein
LRAAQYSRESAWKQRLPSIGFTGSYGVLGFTVSTLAPNWSAGGTLTIPIFQGGKVEADVQQASAVLKERQAQVDNLKGSIEQDIQNALLDLKAAAEQVEVAKTGLDYAQQTLEQSQDRFAAGVTNNVEVIQAQQQLASANDQYIASLYAHNIGKVLLARAIGNAEQAVKQYLSEPGNTLPANPSTPNANPAVPNTSPATPQSAPGTPSTPAPGAIPQNPSNPPGNMGAVRFISPQPGGSSGLATPASTSQSQQHGNTSATVGQHDQIADR